MLRRIRSQTASLNVGDCVLDLWGVPAAVGGEARVGLSGWVEHFSCGRWVDASFRCIASPAPTNSSGHIAAEWWRSDCVIWC
jgi:hypothetical protein